MQRKLHTQSLTLDSSNCHSWTGEAAIKVKRASLEQGLKDIQDVQCLTLKRLQAA